MLEPEGVFIRFYIGDSRQALLRSIFAVVSRSFEAAFAANIVCLLCKVSDEKYSIEQG